MSKGHDRETRRRLVLEAAAHHLRSANVEWSRSLTYDQLVEWTGIDRSQIASDFGTKDTLVSDLVEFCLTPDPIEEAGWIGDMVDAAKLMLAETEDPIEDKLRAHGMEPREGLSPADFITVMTALVEGLAIRAFAEPQAVPQGTHVPSKPRRSLRPLISPQQQLTPQPRTAHCQRSAGASHGARGSPPSPLSS